MRIAQKCNKNASVKTLQIIFFGGQGRIMGETDWYVAQGPAFRDHAPELLTICLVLTYIFWKFYTLFAQQKRAPNMLPQGPTIGALYSLVLTLD